MHILGMSLTSGDAVEMFQGVVVGMIGSLLGPMIGPISIAHCYALLHCITMHFSSSPLSGRSCSLLMRCLLTLFRSWTAMPCTG